MNRLLSLASVQLKPDSFRHLSDGLPAPDMSAVLNGPLAVEAVCAGQVTQVCNCCIEMALLFHAMLLNIEQQQHINHSLTVQVLFQ